MLYRNKVSPEFPAKNRPLRLILKNQLLVDIIYIKYIDKNRKWCYNVRNRNMVCKSICIGGFIMIFGRHINRYYLKYSPALLLGVLALFLVDYMQLVIPELYGMVIEGIEKGVVELDSGEVLAFDLNFLLDKVCLPLLFVIVSLVFGRFLWRVCFFGAGIRLETALRGKMFDRCKDLSQQYYQVNKVGNMMSFFTNDLDTVQE